MNTEKPITKIPELIRPIERIRRRLKIPIVNWSRMLEISSGHYSDLIHNRRNPKRPKAYKIVAQKIESEHDFMRGGGMKEKHILERLERRFS